MSVRKGCFILLCVVVLPVVVLGLILSLLVGKEQQSAATAPVTYERLHPDDKNDVPPFAANIYKACWTHWQVGEWAWCFDVPPDSEEVLREWVRAKGGEPMDVGENFSCCHMEPPEWWRRPADARLVSYRLLEHGVSMRMWYSSTAHRVWIMYAQ